ncbi:hypothetical protein ACSBR2_016614 [Camellia fascicularis]
MNRPVRGCNRGRGRGITPFAHGNCYPNVTEFPWITIPNKKSSQEGSSSTESAKDTSPHEETNLYFEIVDIKWMIDPWEIKDRYLHNQNFKPHFDQYRYIYRANAQKYYLRRFYS